MPRSHVCHACGLDLAHTRAALDPRYALAIVVCPRCETAAVRRRRDPVIDGWRRLVRTVKASSLIAVQVLLALVLLLGFGYTVFGLERVAQDINFSPLRLALVFTDGTDLDRVDARDRLVTLLTTMVVGAAGGGAWLTVGFAHLRKPTPWIFWGSVLMLFSFLYPAVAGLDAWLERLTGGLPRYRGPEGDELLFRALFAPAWLLLAFGVGRPVGRVVARVLAGMRAAGWRKAYRARRRRRRMDA